MNALRTLLRARGLTTIRARLLALGVLPVLMAIPLLVAVIYLGFTTYDRLLTNKVRADLATGANDFDRVLESTGARVRSLAESAALVRWLPPASERVAGPAAHPLAEWLEGRRLALNLDHLCLLDAQDRVRACAGTGAAGQAYGRWLVLANARAGQSATALDVFEPAFLQRLAPRLLDAVRIPLRPTTSARPDARTEEARALVIHSAAPVWLEGQDAGTVVGAVVLNRNVDLVDHINRIVYPPTPGESDQTGTATVFLGDVRIATSVRLPHGDRAIGTRVSQAVHEAVLERGQSWLDRAFVVSDWYVSGYQPLTDSRGQRVGMLYVGFLESPYASARYRALTVLVGVFVVTLLFALWLARKLSLSIIRPVERMHQVMSEVEGGALSSRVHLPARTDELGALADHFDRLLQRLELQTRELQDRGTTLDAQVAERTRALADALDQLRDTQRQMIRQEQLAAVGQLTAGLAHEINNPVAVIQGNVELMTELLGSRAEPVRQEIGLIREQVQRIRLIVAKLLQFARPTEYAGYVERTPPESVAQDCLLLVSHLLRRARIMVEQTCTATRAVGAHHSELQQVLVNLLVNAIQAMPEQGWLGVRVVDRESPDGRAGVAFEVSDTGPGIAPELRERLFEPFFTTKQNGTGTGLGLWVSRTLVRRWGGTLEAGEAPGGGAVFTVWVPAHGGPAGS
ncbi:sensor histidine kinase [Sphaerotilus hippei]|uniref:sensor histidine kinase n=1 Tax=Sphaerotilus hippei TaxID=744406 RepID=UPI000D752845|nr:cache domain-containing protein [Sphaerotilus hippei]